MWAKQINVWKSTAHGSGFIYLPLMSRPSIILRRELKLFPLGAECQSQSTNTFRSLFPAPGVTGLEAARVTKGSPQTTLAQGRRRGALSPELWGVRVEVWVSVCCDCSVGMSSPARAECQPARSHQQIIHSVSWTSQTRTTRGSFS